MTNSRPGNAGCRLVDVSRSAMTRTSTDAGKQKLRFLTGSLTEKASDEAWYLTSEAPRKPFTHVTRIDRPTISMTLDDASADARLLMILRDQKTVFRKLMKLCARATPNRFQHLNPRQEQFSVGTHHDVLAPKGNQEQRVSRTECGDHEANRVYSAPEAAVSPRFSQSVIRL